MADENIIKAGLTLPPNVPGRVWGYLVMKVDEVLWARKCPGDVSAVVMWWGEEEPTTFRPTNVAEKIRKRICPGVMYEICTSLSLFDKYLHKCGSLNIAVADKYGSPIGCASVSELWQMIQSSPYQGYYPIVNNFGNRIGDLHVSFNLRMIGNSGKSSLPFQRSLSSQGTKTKELKRLYPTPKKLSSSSMKNKEEKTKQNEKVAKNTTVAKETDTDLPQRVTADKENFLSGGTKYQEKDKIRVSPTTNIISQILEHGTRLRDAMAASVIEDSVQLNLENTSNPDVPLSVTSSIKKSESTTHFHQKSHEAAGKEWSCEKNVCPLVKKKVLEYLSGKPMPEWEEKEALRALQGMTPTKDLFENDIPDSHQIPWQDEDSKEMASVMDESSELVTKITHYDDKNHAASNVSCPFKIDSKILSQVNCLRITVHSLILNSVGSKRIRSSVKKKENRSQPVAIVQPPGISYFVEYKFPLSGSRPWESNVRYCSKRFNGHEVSFGDRSVHNLPTMWRSSFGNEANANSLIPTLCFKVCARHLHQRIPISLGSADLDSSKALVDSANLRHEFDLSVIASDCLPVAQLRICIELGRDRIHFGGLLDPENNSLGIKSPKENASSTKASITSKTASKNAGGSVTTVTRNVTVTPSSVNKLRMPVHRAAQANQMVKQIVRNTSNGWSEASESSSAPSTGRSLLKPLQTNIPACYSTSAWKGDHKLNVGHIRAAMDSEFVKHELAISILHLSGINMSSYSGVDKGFYISYKFPAYNALTDETVDWRSYSTDLTINADGEWKRHQYTVHSAILSQSESFYFFLQRAVKLYEHLGLNNVTFSLYARYFGNVVKDQLVGEAMLPVSTILTLEKTYKEAAQSSPNFLSSSCSSIFLELPFKCSNLNPNTRSLVNNICIKVKLDYRHSSVQDLNLDSNVLKNFPHSRGDSVSENMPHRLLERKESFDFGSKLRDSTSHYLPQDKLFSTIPNWARSPTKEIPTFSRFEGTVGCKRNSTVDFINVTEHSKHPTSVMMAKAKDTTWKPTEDILPRMPPSSQTRESESYVSKNCPYGHKECHSISDKTSYDECAPKTYYQKSRNSLHSSLQYLKAEDQLVGSEYLADSSKYHVIDNTSIKKVDVATSTSSFSYQNQNHMLSRGTSPVTLETSVEDLAHKMGKTEQLVGQEDKSQQVVISSVNQESQTTPRENGEVSKTHVEVSADIIEILSGNDTDMSLKIPSTLSTLSHCSTDKVELTEVDSEQLVESRLSDTGEPVRSFQAKVGVEYALHLQSVQSTHGIKENSPFFVCVSVSPCEFDDLLCAAKSSSVSVTPAVVNNGEPEWYWKRNLLLPSDLLYSNKKQLVFKIWQTEKLSKDPCVQDLNSANLIGFSALDLTVLSAGLPLLSGWYNIMDFTGACRGQIKLSVEPLESIPKTIDLSGMSIGTLRGQISPLVFVAHGAYNKFPSHVTQLSDMRIQRVDLGNLEQSTSAALDSYMVAMQNCCRPITESLYKNCHQVTLEERDVVPSERIDTEILHNHASKLLSPLSIEVDQDSATYLSTELQKEPSFLLREKLFELDTMIGNMKPRLQNQIEPSCTLGFADVSCRAAKGEKMKTGSHSLPKHNQTDEVLLSKEVKPCGTCASSSESESGASGECFSEHLFIQKGKKNTRKQRKMWEKQDDLIEFGALNVDSTSDNEKSSPIDDESDWLSESAMQQVFNPFLFNDILDNINSRPSVKVIELEDTESSDDNKNSPTVASCENAYNPMLDEEIQVPLKTSKRRTRKGDETYRKEILQPSFNGYQVVRTNISACDADSGVDVDSSANFNPSAVFGSAEIHYNPTFAHHVADEQVKTGREELSSCSLSSSRHFRSTLPSSTSASATSTDSPQHS